MWRFNLYRDRILPLFTIIGSLASVLAFVIPLLFSSEITSWWMIVLIVMFVILMLASIALITKFGPTTRVYSVEDKLGIRNYMFRWIKNGRRVAIWTRDMSWVEDEEMELMLRHKAESQELIICLPTATDTSDVLKQSGAELLTYGTLDPPAASFTIVNYDREGSRVAVGRRMGNQHIIQEFSAGDNSTFHMARDLVKLARELSRA